MLRMLVTYNVFNLSKACFIFLFDPFVVVLYLIPRDGQRYIAEQKPCSSNLILHKCMIPNDQLYFMKLKATITKQVPSTVDQ